MAHVVASSPNKEVDTIDEFDPRASASGTESYMLSILPSVIM